ncbi:MAG: hypothetical protein ACFFC3_09025 [Candidatus Odinarchaeota archaeon]
MISGIFNRIYRPVYHKELFGDHNPINDKISRDKRLEKIRKIIESK